MITWESKSEYYDMENGEEITKKNAISNYIKIKYTKIINTKNLIDNGKGEKFGNATITYCWQCRSKPKQLSIFQKEPN